jgi:2-amino-4-hydroxy-6-hydroxymethyldihydropteridine diphosphokinase
MIVKSHSVSDWLRKADINGIEIADEDRDWWRKQPAFTG